MPRADSSIRVYGSKTDFECRLTFYIAYVKIDHYNFQKWQVLFYMKIVGIIAEYNPFHKGHEYQIRYAREILGADYIVL